MKKFKVGDKVWCSKKNKYNITDYHIRCVVLDVLEFSLDYWDLKVRIEEGPHYGSSFFVHSYDFEYCKKRCITVV